MKMWSPISTFISLLMGIYLIFFIYQIDTETERQFNEQRLRYAVDYATEAGFRASLSSDNLDIQYEDMTDVKISPANALKTFEMLMCISYDMPISDENCAFIESYMPTAVVACTDGYYVAKTTEMDMTLGDDFQGGSFGLTWGVKIPYYIRVEQGVADNEIDDWYIAFSMRGVPLYRVYYDGIVITETLDPNDDTYYPYYDNAILGEKINQEVNLAVRLRNEHFSAKDGNTNLFYVPADFSTVRNNAIQEPSFITMMQNVDFAGSQDLDVISVGGVKATKHNLVVGFIANKDDTTYGLKSGYKYYCYADKIPDDLTASNGITADSYYQSTDEAALKGYYPAISLMAAKSK